MVVFKQFYDTIKQPWMPHHSRAILRDGGLYWLAYYYYNYTMAIKR